MRKYVSVLISCLILFSFSAFSNSGYKSVCFLSTMYPHLVSLSWGTSFWYWHYTNPLQVNWSYDNNTNLLCIEHKGDIIETEMQHLKDYLYYLEQNYSEQI